MSSKVRVTFTLPPVPNKLYFTIGETSGLCEVKPHVLRYWEQEFSQLNPTKRRGGRRSYQQKDISMIRTIRELLYQRGFTISGAKQQLLHLDKTVVALPSVVESVPVPAVIAPVIFKKMEVVTPKKISQSVSNISTTQVNQLIGELQNLLDVLKG